MTPAPTRSFFDTIPPEVTKHILSFAVEPSSASSVQILLVSQLFRQMGQGFLYDTVIVMTKRSALSLDFLCGMVKIFGYENGRRNFLRVKRLKLDFPNWLGWMNGDLRNLELFSEEDSYEMFPNLHHLEFRIRNFSNNRLWQHLLGKVAPRQISMEAWPPQPIDTTANPFDGVPFLFSKVEDLTINQIGRMIKTQYPNLRRLNVELRHDYFMSTLAEELVDLDGFWDPISDILLGCEKLESVVWHILVNTDLQKCPFTTQDVDKHLQSSRLPNAVKPTSRIY